MERPRARRLRARQDMVEERPQRPPININLQNNNGKHVKLNKLNLISRQDTPQDKTGSRGGSTARRGLWREENSLRVQRGPADNWTDWSCI